MANLDLSKAAYGLDMIEPNLVAFGSAIAATATAWSYLTPAGHKVIVRGDGMTFDADGRPTGGTATSIEIDAKNDSYPELVITGISVAAAALDDDPASFWRFLEGNDVILGPELAQGAAQGIFRMFGDGLAARDGATGGNDIIRLGDRGTSAQGDVWQVGSPTAAVDYRGGDDEMLGLLTDFNQYAYGDAAFVYGGSRLSGGNDTILIQSAARDASASGDAARAWSLNGQLARVVGGNDYMTAGPYFHGALVGDVYQQEARTFIRGGGDTLNGGTFGDLLAGDVHTMQGTPTAAARLVGGNDTINGNGGADIIAGDLFRSISLDCTIAGGDDTIDGGSGDDVISGDVHSAYPGLSSITGGDDVIRGGAGNDRIYGDSTDNNFNAVGVGGDDRLYGEDGDDRLFGHGGNDTLDGGEGLDTLTGGDGDDWLSGGGNVDRLDGGRGDDVMDGGAAGDFLHGGDGNDSYFVNSIGDLVEEAAGAGIDTVWSTIPAYTLTANVENLRCNAVGDFTGVGNALGNLIAGLAGNDTLDGGDGNDVLEGGAGQDRLVGGNGIDTASYATASGGVWAVLTGSPNSQGGDAAGDSYSGVENLAGSAFNDVLQGDSQANRISGGAGNDQLIGFGGDDLLIGGAGNEYLIGGDGDDVLRGGWHADILFGGLGDDVLDFNSTGDSAPGARDIVRSLNDAVDAFEGAGAAGGDVIDLRGIDANAARAGNQAFGFGGTGIGRVSVVSSGTDTLIRCNVDRDADFEFELLIEDGGVLASAYRAGDFLL